LPNQQFSVVLVSPPFDFSGKITGDLIFIEPIVKFEYRQSFESAGLNLESQRMKVKDFGSIEYQNQSFEADSIELKTPASHTVIIQIVCSIFS